MNRESIPAGSETFSEIPPCGIGVDEEGYWHHEGNRLFREEILELLYAGLQMTPDGRFLIRWKDCTCFLDVADTPYVVSRVDRVVEEGSGLESIRLGFRNLAAGEPLDPSTLRVGKENVLYCDVKSGRFPARFSRPAYYQLAQWVEEGEDGFSLSLNGIRYTISV